MMPTSPDAAAAIQRAVSDLDLYCLRVEVVGGCVHLRGLAGSYEAKRLAGVRAQGLLPEAFVSNALRVAEFWRAHRHTAA
jgi:hypothetical protein